jgi:hypothetical protein
MSQATLHTHASTATSDAVTRSPSESSVVAGAHARRLPASGSRAAAVPHDVIDRLSLYIAGPQDERGVAELVARAGGVRPAGALMLAAADGEVLAAGSLSDGDVVGELSPAGAAAAAVIRYRIAGLRRRQGARGLVAA